MKVLDHGYIKLIQSWGSDEGIIEAARMSTDAGFKGWGPLPCPKGNGILSSHDDLCLRCGGTGRIAGDEKLLKYLYTHKHTTPFEMAGLTIEVQAPIMVFREWHRHRTQSFSELSARYTQLPNVYYIPSIERLMDGKQGQKNKQSSEEGFSPADARKIQADFIYATEQSLKIYEHLLKVGVARELARLVIPVNFYSKMRASANLKNWLDFLRLRMDKGAQYEIRMYANAVADVVKEGFPRTYELFSGE